LVSGVTVLVSPPENPNKQTNCTGEFFLWVIKWANHSIAVSFNMVEQGKITTGSTSWY